MPSNPFGVWYGIRGVLPVRASFGHRSPAADQGRPFAVPRCPLTFYLVHSTAMELCCLSGQPKPRLRYEAVLNK